MWCQEAPCRFVSSDDVTDPPTTPRTEPFFTLQSLTHQAAPPPEARTTQQLLTSQLLYDVRILTTSHHGRAPKERDPSPVQCYFVAYRSTTISAARRAQAALHEARGAGLPLEAAAKTSHHGRVLEERGLSPAQCPFDGQGPTTTSPTRRAQAATSSAAPPP